MSSEVAPASFQRRGFLVVISGPSGVGKTSFCTHLMDTRRDTVRSISGDASAASGEETAETTRSSSAEFESKSRRAMPEHAEVTASCLARRALVEQGS